MDDRIEDMDPDVAMGFVTAGLNRELVEEVNADLSIVKVTGRDYVYTLSDKVPYVTQLVVEPTLCHFFTKEVNFLSTFMYAFISSVDGEVSRLNDYYVLLG